jgi:hypothetical protein
LLCLQQQINKIKENLGPDNQVILKLSNDVRLEIEKLINEYENIPIPNFRTGDIIKGEESTKLESDHYDLAYCKLVLYHIYCREKGSNYNNTRSALHEMKRIIKTGGFIVAYEKIYCSPEDNTHVDLSPIFNDITELQFVDKISIDENIVYIYLKRK